MELTFPSILNLSSDKSDEYLDYSVEVPETVASKLKTLIYEDIAVVIDVTLKRKKGEDKDITVIGRIQKFYWNAVVFKSSFRFGSENAYARKVRFEYNRMSTRASLRGIEHVTQEKSMLEYLKHFEDPYGRDHSNRHASFCDEDFQWTSSHIRNNNEQLTAIKNIVNCTAFPYPYLIFGPPGELF